MLKYCVLSIFANKYIHSYFFLQIKLRVSTKPSYNTNFQSKHFDKRQSNTIIMTKLVIFSAALVVACVATCDAFSANTPAGLVARSSLHSRRSQLYMSAAASPTGGAAAASDDAPPLRRTPPRKIALFIEPTPFTHVSGYSNRFKELLRYLKKAGDNVEIVTTDEKTPAKDLPEECQGFKISHTLGFVFPLYNHITLTLDLPDLKGAKMIDRLKPDLIHVTSP